MGFLAMTAAVIGGKAVILLALALLSRLRGRDRWIFTLGLAQGGEFGFVLASYAATLGAVDDGLAQTLHLVIALSMLATPLLFLALRRLGEGTAPTAPATPIDQRHPVIVAGAGRFGRTVQRLLRSAGQQAVLLDTDMAAVGAMRSLGHRVFLAVW